MAETTTKKKTAKPVEQKTIEEPEVFQKPIVPKEVDIHQYIVVRNGFQGRLIYVSKRTGEKFIWEKFGDEQEMELLELKNAKGGNKAFYTKNWWLFNEEDQWVIEYLGVGQYYKNALTIDNFDELFKLPPAQLEKRIESLSAGQKGSVIYRARQLIADGEIDSNKVIATLEKALNVELIER